MEEGNNSVAVNEVISNPLLLNCIFSKMNEMQDSSLKELRLVCSQWNDLILTLVDSRIHFILNHDEVQNVCDPQTFIEFAETMDERLSRNVALLSQEELRNVISQHNMDRQEWLLESVGYINLKYCIQKFSSTIETINLLGTGIKIDYVKVLHQLLQSQCPNLIELKLCVDHLPEQDDARNRPSYLAQTWTNVDFASIETNGGPIAPKLKMEYIHVEFLDTLFQPPRIISGPLHNLYSSLIVASPNLLGLRQNIIAFPGCSTLVQPKSFEFEQCFYHYDFNSVTGELQVNFTLEGLSRMIREMAHSLEYLKLDVRHSHCGRHATTNIPIASATLGFDLPLMMNLKIFKCTDTAIFFRNERTLANVSPLFVGDKLQLMEIGLPIGSQSPGITHFIRRIGNYSLSTAIPIANHLTSLSLDGLDATDPYLMNLKSAFPALKTLSINKNFGIQFHQFELDGDEESCNLAQALRVAQELSLENLEMKQLLPSDFLTFVNVLHNNVDFFRSGVLKTLLVVGSGNEMDMESVEDDDDARVDEVVRKVNEAFMSMQLMTSVTIIRSSMTFPAHVSQQIFGFIANNSLPIFFKSK